MKDEKSDELSFYLLPVLLIGVIVFFTGLNWGLPSHRVDQYLFGDHPVWTGQEILDLLPKNTDTDRGADVAAGPIADRNISVLLNGSDVQRAEIVRRYRLFSHQPDEMITFMSLARMNPHAGDFDPRLYQYGSLWIYPVGGLLKIGSLFHLIQLRSDMAFYLDNPEQFGNFYVVARFYTALWAILGIAVIFQLAGELGGDVFTQCASALGFIFLPVVMSTSHEAKPHLPGTVLVLLAVLMALRFFSTGRQRYAGLMILFCGLACSMVLSTLPLLLLIPVVFFMKDPRMAIRGLWGMGIAIIIYLLLNPYIWIDLLFHRARLSSNISNTAAMYHLSIFSAIGDALRLTATGTSWSVFIVGIFTLAILLTRKDKRRLLLIIAGLLVWVPFVVFAAHKPAEYARFALLPDVLLMLLTILWLAEFPQVIRPWGVIALLIGIVVPGLAYWRGYLADTDPNNTRMQLAADLAQWSHGRSLSIALTAEPAPYCAPPMNLFDWKLILLPRDSTMRASDLPLDFSISAVDTSPTPMSWASKQFAVLHGTGK